MKYLSTTIGKIAAAAILLVLVLAVFQFRSCSAAKQQAAQSKVDQAQIGAMQNSAADAVATQGRANANEQASEALTRTNDREIRNAAGANDAVNPASRDAGLRALCRRAAYRNTERCRVFNAAAR